MTFEDNICASPLDWKRKIEETDSNKPWIGYPDTYWNYVKSLKMNNSGIRYWPVERDYPLSSLQRHFDVVALIVRQWNQMN